MGLPLRSLALRSALCGVACLALVACERQADTADATPPPPASSIPASGTVILQTAMKDVVKPQTEVVLNTLINALTLPPDPYVDPAKLTDGDWEIMETAATALRDQALALRDNPIQVTAAPGDRLFGELELGTHSAADVQGYIDAYPDHFKEDAEALRVKADEWLTAIQARDTVAAWRVALDLDPACVDCHEVFWTGEPPHEHDGDH